MKILKHISNSGLQKKFLIPESSGVSPGNWVEIDIDYKEQTFLAKKMKLPSLGEEWIELNDYTFPSSLLNEFLISNK